MESFLKKVQKGAQRAAENAKSGQLGSNLRQSINQAKTKAGESFHQVKSKAEEHLQEALKVDYEKYLERPLALEGKIWKRRGGIYMAKYALNQTTRRPGDSNNKNSVWELRRFELRGSALLYYSLPPSEEEEEVIEFGVEDSSIHTTSSTNNKKEDAATLNTGSMRDGSETATDDATIPRGYLDFKEDKTLVYVCSGHSSGAPSPFCLAVVQFAVSGGVEKTKFMLSFDDQSTMMQWSVALSNVAAQCSVDDYNVQLVEASNPKNQTNNNEVPVPFLLLRRPPVKEPPKKDGVIEEAKTIQSASHVLWIADNNYYVVKKDSEGGHEISTTKPEEEEAGIDPRQQQQRQQQQQQPVAPVAALQEMELQHQIELRALVETQKNNQRGIEQKVQDLEAANATQQEDHAQEIVNLKRQMQDRETAHKSSQKNMLHRVADLQKTIRKLQKGQPTCPSEQQQQQKMVEESQAEQIKVLEQKIQELRASESAKIEAVTKASAVAEKMRRQQQDKEIAELREKLQSAAQRSGAGDSNEAAVVAQLEKEVSELKLLLEEVQSKSREEAAAANAQHQKELAELQRELEEAQSQRSDEASTANAQQTVELLQTAPPADDDDDEFHDAM